MGFHATNPEYWASISRYGLIPGKGKQPGQSWEGAWRGKGTYFHLSFPEHELHNGVAPDGEFFVVVIETKLHGHAGFFVPDEDVSGDLDYTPEAIKNKESIAYGYIVPPTEFIRLHLPDVPEAREWAKQNVKKKIEVQFHDVGLTEQKINPDYVKGLNAGEKDEA